MRNRIKICFVELFFRKPKQKSIIKLKGSQKRVKEYKNVEEDSAFYFHNIIKKR